MAHLPIYSWFQRYHGSWLDICIRLCAALHHNQRLLHKPLRYIHGHIFPVDTGGHLGSHHLYQEKKYSTKLFIYNMRNKDSRKEVIMWCFTSCCNSICLPYTLGLATVDCIAIRNITIYTATLSKSIRSNSTVSVGATRRRSAGAGAYASDLGAMTEGRRPRRER